MDISKMNEAGERIIRVLNSTSVSNELRDKMRGGNPNPDEICELIFRDFHATEEVDPKICSEGLQRLLYSLSEFDTDDIPNILFGMALARCIYSDTPMDSVLDVIEDFACIPLAHPVLLKNGSVAMNGVVAYMVAKAKE